ncbi:MULTISPECIES: DUF4258 domain-containing protein [Niallia]|uniref:DUF4258 domain-containing protein n=1 Tax=Niallia TaxID=2837506 RepID=UPI001EEFB978|nr:MULTISPECIES: DUF4258 domain-containing protein [Niallia]MDK8642432.1 DUF4258 domain-containing protein [Niallia taxi]MED4040590.1 DUF4258 domain-containing protein [Niallia taxi]MED4057030.1 DUF4258 domain-containing protein [Niallia taxi]MED4121624.1 DUF4258 domain-containing protein [Niallia taxi]UPO91272.1 DUF4258 domain-containing protein [Niallia sp. Man26]
MKVLKLKEIKKVLMTGKGVIKISMHTKERLVKRGYSKGDIVSAIFTGSVSEIQGYNKISILGRDKDHNPIVVVIAKKRASYYKVVTVMPPIDRSRFRECI